MQMPERWVLLEVPLTLAGAESLSEAGRWWVWVHLFTSMMLQPL